MDPERKWWGALPQFANSHKIWNWLGENCLGKGLKLLRYFGSTVSWRFIMSVFTLEDKQIVWHLSIWCEFVPYCHRLVCLDGQIVWEKLSFQMVKSDDLFIEKFVRPVFTSDEQWRFVRLRTICRSRQLILFILQCENGQCNEQKRFAGNPPKRLNFCHWSG